MLQQIGDDRTVRANMALGALMSFIAGALNAVGFLAAGSFTANMTGNATFAAEELARGNLPLALSFAGLIAVFVLGAILAATLIQAGQSRGWRWIYALAFAGQGAALCALGLLLALVPGAVSQVALVVSLSALMGFRNAATTMISKAQVRTTHVSGMLTDIGIEVAGLLGAAPERPLNKVRLRLHGLTFVGFVGGGIVGAFVYPVGLDWLVLGCGGVLGVVSASVLVTAILRQVRG